MLTFIKYLKWFVSITAFIFGIYCLQSFSVTNEPLYIGGLIFCFGIMVLFSKSTYEAHKTILAASLVTLVGGAALSHFVMVPFVPFLTGFYIGFYKGWVASTAVIGVPIMLWAFEKDD